MEALFECPICHENFDLLDKLPMNLKVCGHSICSYCLAGILNNKNRQPRCPFDNLELPSHKNVHDFPVFLLAKEAIQKNKEILEKQSQKEKCPKHDKKISYICFDDKEKLCSKCLGYHAKKNHELMELDELKKKTDETRQKIKQFVKDVTIIHKDTDKIIDEKWQQYTNEIRKKFSQFKSLVDKREQEIISEINCYFESQKKEIRSLVGKGSELLTDLAEKESKLANILNHIDFLANSQVFKNINKQIDEWKSKISSEEIFNKFWSKLDQNNQVFCDKFILGQNEFFSKIQSTGLESNQHSINNILMKPNNQIINDLKIKSLLNIELVDNCLIITTANEQKEILIEQNKWNQANEINLTLNKTLSEDDESLLDHIWQGFKTFKSLDFQFQSGTVSKSLSEILSRGTFTCSSISIDIKEYDTAKYPEVLFLIKQVLCKVGSVESLTLNAEKANFPSQTMKNILNFSLLDGKKMKHFILYFQETNLMDEDIQNMFVPMLNLDTFHLNMARTNITDKSLETCGKNTLSTAHKLQDLLIIAENTSITDYGVESVLKNFNSLICFALNLYSTGITDKTIQLISAKLLNQFIHLKRFGLNLGSTRVSDNCLSQFFRPMPNLEYLAVGVENTAITDKTINNFVQNTLMSITKPLSDFGLALYRTKCTDRSISELLTNLNCEEYLCLNLNCEGVTDASLIPFVREKLPTMRKLGALIVNVCETTVSQETKDQINALMERINKL